MATSPVPLDIYVSEPEEGRTVLHLRGEVDCSSAPLLGQVARCALACGTQVLTLDCREVTFADSALVSTVLEARALGDGRPVTVEHLGPERERLFRLLGVDLGDAEHSGADETAQPA